MSDIDLKEDDVVIENTDTQDNSSNSEKTGLENFYNWCGKKGYHNQFKDKEYYNWCGKKGYHNINGDTEYYNWCGKIKKDEN